MVLMQKRIVLFELLECLKEFKEEFAKQNDRIANIELQNERQDEETKSVRRELADHRMEMDEKKNKVDKYLS